MQFTQRAFSLTLSPFRILVISDAWSWESPQTTNAIAGRFTWQYLLSEFCSEQTRVPQRKSVSHFSMGLNSMITSSLALIAIPLTSLITSFQLPLISHIAALNVVLILSLRKETIYMGGHTQTDLTRTHGSVLVVVDALCCEHEPPIQPVSSHMSLLPQEPHLQYLTLLLSQQICCVGPLP